MGSTCAANALPREHWLEILGLQKLSVKLALNAVLMLTSVSALAADRRLTAREANGAVALSSSSMSIEVSHAYRVIETRSGTTARNIIIENLTGRSIIREGIRLRGAIDGFTLRNFRLEHSATPNHPPDLPEGIHIMSGRNFVLEKGQISDFQMIMAADRYWNGDGIATERGVTGVTIHDVTVEDNTDAGLDLKSSENFLDDVTAARNNRNFRFWSDVEAGTLRSIDPTKRGGTASSAHIQITGNNISPPKIHISRLIVRSATSKAPIFLIENGAATVVIDDYDIIAPKGTPVLIGGAAKVYWGNKGVPKL